MKRFLISLGFLLGTLSGLSNAQKAEPNKAILNMEASLLGQWKLTDGLPIEKGKDSRVWSFGKDHTLTDSKEDRGMHYFLVQTADGEIWMLMVYTLSETGPMVAKVQIKGDTLTVQHVGRTPEGSYGAVREGTLTFKQLKDDVPPNR